MDRLVGDGSIEADHEAVSGRRVLLVYSPRSRWPYVPAPELLKLLIRHRSQQLPACSRSSFSMNGKTELHPRPLAGPPSPEGDPSQRRRSRGQHRGAVDTVAVPYRITLSPTPARLAGRRSVNRTLGAADDEQMSNHRPVPG